jgi:hypothetical protein
MITLGMARGINETTRNTHRPHQALGGLTRHLQVFDDQGPMLDQTPLPSPSIHGLPVPPFSSSDRPQAAPAVS